jgi:hypothetical protein
MGSGVAPRISLGRDPLPDKFFLIGGHEDPFSDLGHRATTAPADIIEGGRTHGDTRCIRTFRGGVHHRVETLDI